MNLFAAANLSVALSCIILSAIILSFGRTHLRRHLLLFNLAVLIWGGGTALAGLADSEAASLAGWKLGSCGGLFIGPLFYDFVCAFTEAGNRKLRLFAYLQGLAFATTTVATGLAVDRVRFTFGVYYLDANALYATAIAFYLFFVLASYRLLVANLRRTRGHKHEQTLYIIFGFLFGFVGGTSTFLPMFRLDWIYPVGNAGITIYVIIVTYAIFRRQLFDINLIFRKGLIYSFSVAAATGIFIILVMVLTPLVSDFAGPHSRITTWAAALVIAFVFTPLKERIQMLIDRFFYKTAVRHYDAIQQVSRALAASIDLQHIERVIVDTVFTTLNLKNVSLLAATSGLYQTVYARAAARDGRPSTTMASDAELIRLLTAGGQVQLRDDLAPDHPARSQMADAEVMVPIFIDQKLRFLLRLGEKLSEDAVSSEDIKMLTTLADQAAISLKNALLYEELELRVAERTSKLKQAQEDLLRAERLAVVGETSGRVAHEVLNPITSILAQVEHNLGSWPENAKVLATSMEVVNDWRKEFTAGTLCEYLHRHNEGETTTYGQEDFELLTKLMASAMSFQEKRREDLQFIYEQTHRIIKIISALRESARSRHSITEVEIGKAIREALEVMEDSLEKRRIEVKTTLAPDLPMVMADESELIQVVINLFRNAMQSIDEKKVRGGLIEVVAAMNGSTIEIRIKDTGNGIPAEIQTALFNFNFTSKTREHDIGLGLGISRRLVRACGGDLVLEESTVGVGSTFLVTLPGVLRA